MTVDSTLYIKKVTPILADTYLAVIKNSIGSEMFRNLYAEVNGQKTDITKNGDLSCAYYVSSVLYLFKLIGEIHATVRGTIKDLEKSGWVEVGKPKAGCVLVWKEMDFDGEDRHRHIGFYIGEEKAVCNDYKLGYPTEFNWKYREIESILWHPKLEN